MQPLDGVKILDLSQYVPGPFCTLICSRLGADVVKLERPPDGDPLRGLDAKAFRALNSGKRSVSVDLKDPARRGLVDSLAAGADVLVEGFRPGVAGRLGLGFEELHRSNPRLVYVSISGYGQAGELAARAGHDLNYMTLGGALGERPAVVPIQVADYAGGGLYATIAILAALMERERTGEGRHLDVAMTEGIASFGALRALDQLSGRTPGYAIYQTADGRWLSVGAVEPGFWAELCDVLARPDLVRRHLDPAAKSDVDAIFRERTLAEWMQAFEGRDVCLTPVDPDARDRYLAERLADIGDRPWLGLSAPEGPAPRLGADEAAVVEDWVPDGD